MEPNQVYHIYNHANGTENIFQREDNYRYFLQLYDKYLGGVVETFAYCLMPNHFHMMVRVRSDLSGFQNLTGLLWHPSKNPAIKAFSDFFNSYSKSFNKMYGRKGNLFKRSFNRLPIRDEKHWQDTFLYVHLNPYKHGFVKNLNNWKWSSWNAYRYPNKSSMINREEYKIYFEDWKHVEYMMEFKKEILMNKEFE